MTSPRSQSDSNHVQADAYHLPPPGSASRVILPSPSSLLHRRAPSSGSADMVLPRPNLPSQFLGAEDGSQVPRLGGPDDSQGSYQISPILAKVKRRQVTAACSACQKRKSKCNGQRPSCSLCLRRTTTCLYDVQSNQTRTQALRVERDSFGASLNHYRAIMLALRHGSDEEAASVLQRIRADPIDRGKDMNNSVPHQSPPGHAGPSEKNSRSTVSAMKSVSENGTQFIEPDPKIVELDEMVGRVAGLVSSWEDGPSHESYRGSYENVTDRSSTQSPIRTHARPYASSNQQSTVHGDSRRASDHPLELPSNEEHY